MQVIAAERVDVRVRDRSDPRDRGLVGDDVGPGRVEVVDRGGHVAGVPDLDGVDEDLQAQRVASMVVLVGGDLRALADDEVAAQGVQRLALVQVAGDAGALRGVGAVDKQEVGAHDPPVVAERRRERRLWCRVLQPSDEQARRDPSRA